MRGRRRYHHLGPTWWFTLHMIQTPLVGLVCVGLWLMLKDINVMEHVLAGVCAWLSRIATFVTIIYSCRVGCPSVALGSAATSWSLRNSLRAGKLSQEQLSGVVTILNALWVDPSGRRSRFLHQPDGVLGRVLGRIVRRLRVVPRSTCARGAPGDPRGHLRLATPADPCRSAWPHRVPRAYRLRCVALVP